MIDRAKVKNIKHDAVRAFYDGEYHTDSGGRNRLPWQLRRIANRVLDVKGMHVLDVACGKGEWLSELANIGAVPAGIDISTRAVEQCRKRLPSADIREGIAEHLPFEDDRFDLVTCLGSLEHFLDQPLALREMVRVSKPGATFLVLVPNSGFLTRRLGLYRGTRQTAIRETVRSLDEWKELLEQAGLRCVGRWRDLRPLSLEWILSGPWMMRPFRLLQALVLPIWPISWQYQIYFVCRQNVDNDSRPLHRRAPALR